MGHVVYVTNGFAGNLNVALELGNRLREAGHRVTYLCPAQREQLVTGEGHAYIALSADRSIRAEAADIDCVAQRWRRLRLRRALRKRSIDNDEIERIVDRLAPDLLLIDIELHYAIIVTARLGVPTALVTCWFNVFRRPGVPPLHSLAVPGTTLASRLSVTGSWWRLILWKRYRALRERLSPAGVRAALLPLGYQTRRLGDLRALARSRGVRLRRAVDRNQWIIPFVYRHLPVLSFTAWEMEFPHAPSPLMHYVGPMIPKSRSERRSNAGSLAAWRAFRDARPETSSPRPLVYCSLGSYWGTDVAFLRKVIAVFARRREWDLVLGLGGKLAAASLDSLPPNAVALEWAPQLEILELADGALTHGGINTINECIARGVPVVVYSTNRVDQNGCAARVAYHRLGIIGDIDGDDAPQIERNISQILTDREIIGSVDTMHDTFERYTRSQRAIEIVERLMAQGRRTA